MRTIKTIIISSLVFALLIGNVSGQTKPEILVQLGHAGAVNAVAFSPDGRYVLSGSSDKTLKLWDASTGREIRTLTGHKGPVLSVAFSKDGRLALSGGGHMDWTLRIWDVATGKEVKILEKAYSESVAFSPDGRYALSGGSKIKLWDVAKGEEIREFKGHQMNVFSVAFSPDGRYILSGGGMDRTMKLWDASTGSNLFTFENRDYIISVAFSPDGFYILSGDSGGNVKLWDVSKGEKIRDFKQLKIDMGTYTMSVGYVRSVAFSPDGRFALSGSDDGTLKLWDVSKEEGIRLFKGHKDYVFSVAFSPDGRYALSGSWDKTIKLWDISTGKEVSGIGRP